MHLANDSLDLSSLSLSLSRARGGGGGAWARPDRGAVAGAAARAGAGEGAGKGEWEERKREDNFGTLGVGSYSLFSNSQLAEISFELQRVLLSLPLTAWYEFWDYRKALCAISN